MIASKLVFFAGNFATRFAATLMAFMLLKLYGVEATGTFSYILSMVSLLVPVAEFGMGHTYLVASLKGEFSEHALLFVRVTTSLILLGGLIVAIIPLMEIGSSLLIVSLLSIGFLCVNALATYYIGNEQYQKSAAVKFFFALIGFAIVLACWKVEYDFERFFVIYAIAGFLYVCLWALPLIIKGYLHLAQSFRVLLSALMTDSYQFFLSSIVLALSMSLPLIILEAISGAEELGEFSVAFRIVAVFFTLYSIASQIAFFELLKSSGSDKQLIAQIILFLLIGLSATIFLGFLPADLLASIFLLSTDSAQRIIATLQSLKYILLLQALNLPLGQYLASKKLVNYRLVSQLVAILLAVVFAIMFYDHEARASSQIVVAIILNEVILLVLLLACVFKNKVRTTGLDY